MPTVRPVTRALGVTQGPPPFSMSPQQAAGQIPLGMPAFQFPAPPPQRDNTALMNQIRQAMSAPPRPVQPQPGINIPGQGYAQQQFDATKSAIGNVFHPPQPPPTQPPPQPAPQPTGGMGGAQGGGQPGGLGGFDINQWANSPEGTALLAQYGVNPGMLPPYLGGVNYAGGGQPALGVPQPAPTPQPPPMGIPAPPAQTAPPGQPPPMPQLPQLPQLPGIPQIPGMSPIPGLDSLQGYAMGASRGNGRANLY